MIYKFTAQWCGSCLITNKNFKKVASKYQENGLKLEFLEVDIDDESAEVLNLKQKYKAGNVDGVLPVIVFTDSQGNQIQQAEGEKSERELIELIDNYLSKIGKKTPSENFKNQKDQGFLTKLAGIFG